MKEPDHDQGIQEAPKSQVTSELHTTSNAMPHSQDGQTATGLSTHLETFGKDSMNNTGNLPVGAPSQDYVADHRTAQGETTAKAPPAAPDTVKSKRTPKAAIKRSKIQRRPIKLRNGRRFLFRDPSSATTFSSTPTDSTATAPSTTTPASTAEPSSAATAMPQEEEPRPLPEVSRTPSATVSVTVVAKHSWQVDKEILCSGFNIDIAEARACIQCLMLVIRKHGTDYNVNTIEVFTGSHELLNSLATSRSDPPTNVFLNKQLQQVRGFVGVLKRLEKNVVFKYVKDHDGGNMGVEGNNKADEVTIGDEHTKGGMVMSLKRKKDEDEADGGRKKTKSQP